MWLPPDRLILSALLLACVAAGCSRSLPLWKQEALLVRDRDKMQGAAEILPEEFRSVEEAIGRGDSLLLRKETDEAEEYFRLAWTKGKLLETDLAAAKLRLVEAARLQAEAAQRESERLKSMEEERLRREREQADAEAAAAAWQKSETARTPREKSQPVRHTVKRGETLPQIAAQPDVYNDHTLWPLLYRANRDQIRDPRHIWPGQVLRIPRNISREDISEARRYGQEKPLR
jgi:LysM repeat protein